MREIKFKAQRVDNREWVYGYFFKSWDNCYILHGTVNGVPVMVEVNPETVSQFTGLIDKNGVEIYEGDIFHLGERSITYTVVWHDTGLRGKQNGTSSYVGLEHWKRHIEIVGNIYNDKNNET